MTIFTLCGTIVQNSDGGKTAAVCNLIYSEMREKHGDSAARDMARVYAATRWADDAITTEEYKNIVAYINNAMGK